MVALALLDAGSLKTFIRRDVLGRMLSKGAASAEGAHNYSHLSWGVVLPSLPPPYENIDERPHKRPGLPSW